MCSTEHCATPWATRRVTFSRATSMVTPRGVVHGFSNPHAVMARALVINTPDIGSQYFREVASIIDAGAARPDQAHGNDAEIRAGARSST